MKLTRKSEYGLRGLLYLARNSQKRAVLASEVSSSQNIPPSFLNKIFQKLARAGILKSYRGQRGGFALAKRPKEITLRRIVEVLEGPVQIWSGKKKREQSGRDEISSDSSVAMLSVWQRMQVKINKMLDNVTIKDLLKKSNSKSGNNNPDEGN